MLTPAEIEELGRRPFVLVVEDDPGQAGQIAGFLRRRGVAVAVEVDGAQGLRTIAEAKPAVVVMDVRMPHMDGITAARALESLDHKPLVILMSGEPELVSAANAERLGVFAVLEKPIPLPVLERFVRRAMASRAGGA